MLRGSPTTHCHCYSQAVELLEYIHSECPPLGKEEAEQYIDLLVEFKTRVSEPTHRASAITFCMIMHTMYMSFPAGCTGSDITETVMGQMYNHGHPYIYIIQMYFGIILDVIQFKSFSRLFCMSCLKRWW